MALSSRLSDRFEIIRLHINAVCGLNGSPPFKGIGASEQLVGKLDENSVHKNKSGGDKKAEDGAVEVQHEHGE